eukprot:5579325-Lingulodinium_polyedra.AAC.1
MLYMADSGNPTQPWRSMSMEQVVAAIRDLMPPDFHDAWKCLHQDTRLREHSPEEVQAALWVEANGAQH